MEQIELDKMYEKNQKLIVQISNKRDRHVKWALILFVFSQLMGFIAVVLLVLSR